jgi:Amt family ammonium transporter
LALTFLFPSVEFTNTGKSHFNTGDIAWMLMSTALVLIMTPGSGFLLRWDGQQKERDLYHAAKRGICMVIITVMWGIFGFSLAFGDSISRHYWQPINVLYDEGHAGRFKPGKLAPTIPLLLFAMYQLKFAIITPALITGAFAERIRFNSYIIFLCLFSIFIFSPLAHATWHPDGVI